MTDLQIRPARNAADPAASLAPIVGVQATSADVSAALPSLVRAPARPVLASTRGSVVYCHRGMRYAGDWEIKGFTMTMTCDFGTFKISAGQSSPMKVARNLLKSVCKRALQAGVAIAAAPIEGARQAARAAE